jgi:fucose permease
LLLLALAYASFVSLGLPDGLLGVAWPSIRADFDLELNALGALFLTMTTGYAASSMAAGPLAARLGVGGLLALSTALTAVSLIGYALSPGWTSMVLLGLLAGAGGGAIDAALNAHAAVQYSARTVNLLHAFYGVGTTAGPLIMTAVLVAHLSWHHGYLIVAVAQLVLAVCFAATRRLWPAVPRAARHDSARASLLSTLRLPSTQLSMLVFFVYVGLESATGAWTYSLLYEGRGIGMGAAGFAVSLYWGGLFAGRIAYAVLPLRISPGAMIPCCMVIASLAMFALALNLGTLTSFVAVAVVGFASGPIFPLLIATTATRMGAAHTPNAVGMQVSVSALGVALFPAGAGIAANLWGLEALPVGLVAFWMALLGAYVCLAFLTRTASDTAASAADGNSAAGT